MRSDTTLTHTLRFYQSAFSKDAAEEAEIPSGVVLGDWLHANIDGFDPSNERVSYSLTFDSAVHADVSAHYVPAKNVVSSIFKPIFKLLGLTPAKPKTQQTSQRSDDIELSSLQANQAKYGETVREVFGCYKIFPDYLTPAHRYFTDEKDHWTEVLLCVGVGDYASDIFIGGTPVAAYGDNIMVRAFEPDEDLSEVSAAEWWHSVPEVGGTRDGSAGLPLRPSLVADPSAPDSKKMFSGTTIATPSSAKFPADWVAGMKLSITYAQSYNVSGNKISGSLSGISLSVGDTVELGGDISGDYIVDTVQTQTGATSGTPSKLKGKSNFSLEYSVSDASFNVVVGRFLSLFKLEESFADQGEVVGSLNSQLASSPLNGLILFSSEDGKLVITEIPVYEARKISVQNIKNAANVFGNITNTNNSAVTGSAAKLATVSSFTLQDFAQSPQVAQLSIKKAGEYWELVGNTGTAITVQRRKANGDLDWSGFTPAFTLSDTLIELDSTEVDSGWQGWFDVSPANEKATAIEVDLMFPQGLYSTDKKGRKGNRTTNVTLQWRKKDGGAIQERIIQYRRAKLEQISFTEKIELNSGRWQFRAKRNEAEYAGTSGVNKVDLYALRSKIVGAPSSYKNFTTIAIKIKGSEAVSAEADEMVSAIVTRKIDGVATRDISSAFRHIAKGQIIDDSELSRLQAIWNARGDTFDFSFEKTHTLKSAANIALGAGMAEMIVKDGVLTPVRDTKRNPLIRAHSFSAQNTTAPIVRTERIIGDDETYGIDVEYMSSETWRVETVECRKAGLAGAKIEKMKVDGVTDRTQAWRIGMRELMRKRYQRTAISTSTELDALNAHYGDMTFFAEDVPNYGQSALIVEQMPLGVYRISEPIQWAEGADMVAVLRNVNGELGNVRSISKVDKYTFKAEPWLGQTEVMQTVFVGTREKIGISAVVDGVKASGSGAKITAVNYTDRIYEHDNLQADN